MQAAKAYKHYAIRPDQLTAEFVRSEGSKLRKLWETAEGASDAEPWIRAVQAWNAFKAYFNGEYTRASYRLSQDVRSAEAEAEMRRLREEVQPLWDSVESEFLEQMLGSRHRAALEARFGGYFFRRMEVVRRTLDPKNSARRVRVGELTQNYDKIFGMAEVEIRGQTMTLSRARSLASSDVREDRHASAVANQDWLRRNRERLAPIYAEQVKLRDEMGRELGDPDFIPLGYSGMARTDFGPAEVSTFRESIREHVRPMMGRLNRAHAHALGHAELPNWEAGYHPHLSLPKGILDVSTELDRAQLVFDSLSPRLGGHLRRMREEGLIDLENRPGKQAGAYCTSFPDEGRVAVFCNSTGDAHDVDTLTHEMGHAFQAWESQAIELVDLQWPTSEAAEIHSMGMEFMTLPHLHHFFSPEHARRLAKQRWWIGIGWLGTMAAIDHFQHEVYARPDLTLEERERLWVELTSRYQDGVDFSGFEDLRATRWYGILHLFHMPFYYIDYAMAECGAMQLAMIAERDPAEALEIYLRLCRIGGTKSVLEIFQEAGMRSPFDPSLVRDLAEHAARKLELA